MIREGKYIIYIAGIKREHWGRSDRFRRSTHNFSNFFISTHCSRCRSRVEMAHNK